MYSDRRVPFLRCTSLLALATSAILTADRLHPGRAFCPLAAACEKARESALGSLGGIPTSAIGMLAFGGLFLLTLLPLTASRRVLRPAGVVAGLTGAALVLYQAFVIGSFCPLCLVADAAGLVAAGTVLGWRPPPVRPSGRPLPREPLDRQLRWTAVAAVIVALPFAWPRGSQPSWVPLADVNPLLADAGAFPGAPGTSEDGRARPPADGVATSDGAGPARPAHAPALPPLPRLERDAHGRVVLPPPAAATATPLVATGGPAPGTAAAPPPSPSSGMGPRPEETPPWASFAPRFTNPGPEAGASPAAAATPIAAPARAPVPAAAPAPTPAPAPRAVATRPPPPPAPPPSPAPPPVVAAARPQVGIVEYVNAFCPHCRVTHRRLGRVLARLDVSARLRRVYTWPGDEVPSWARACAHAQTLGLEDRYWEELILAESDDLAEILAAGRRAGLDVAALRAAIASGGLAPRLEHDLRIAGSAGLEGLPTLDIGRRRLLGEQTEPELREAIEAALALRRGAR